MSFNEDAKNHCMRFENEIPGRTVFAGFINPAGAGVGPLSETKIIL